MLKSIVTSPKAEIRRNSKVKYDFSSFLSNISDMNKDINTRIQKYEERQSISLEKAGHIQSR